MNVSFFLLILTLFALAFLTKWNFHVLMLIGVTTLLWGSMMWYVDQSIHLPYLSEQAAEIVRQRAGCEAQNNSADKDVRFVLEITKVQTRSDNIPLDIDGGGDPKEEVVMDPGVTTSEGKKDR